MIRQTVHCCEGCGQFLGDRQPGSEEACWFEASMFLTQHGYRWNDLELIDDLCPACTRIIEEVAERDSHRVR
ncbi:MAG TPA: hypothetical protein VIR79_04090 [Nitrospira sp.]